MDKIILKDKNRFEAIEAIHKFLVEYKRIINKKDYIYMEILDVVKHI